MLHNERSYRLVSISTRKPLDVMDCIKLTWGIDGVLTKTYNFNQ